MLIQQIRLYGSDIKGKTTLEIGCGSGVVLAALATAAMTAFLVNLGTTFRVRLAPPVRERLREIEGILKIPLYIEPR